MKHNLFRKFTSGVCVAVLSLTAVSPLFAGETTSSAPSESEESSLAKWWSGKYMTGSWFGVRDDLADRGLKLNGKYYGAFFGVVDSERGSRGFWDQGIEFSGELNFGKLLDMDPMKGVKAFATVRWRDSRRAADPNQFVQANSMFNPSNWISGTQWRLLTFGMEISSTDLLCVKDLLVFRGGWLQPQKEFIDQPLSKLFLNNAVNSAKGVGGNIPFSSSFSTWGGTLKVNPTEWYYAKGGLFMAYPSATASSNHGVAFEGFAPDVSRNGLMAMVETGITPKIGSTELAGKYAIGAYYWGNQVNSFNGTSQYGQYGFYGQADQMIFREPSPETAPMGKDGKSVVTSDSDGKKKMVVADEPKLSDQGLYLFNLISFAPSYNNLFPFYFQTGFVYKGLIPTRDSDQLGFALAYGSYSYDNTLAQRADGDDYQPNYTMFFECFYRIQISGWAYVQPFAQYVVRPNGSSDVQNATILGFATGIEF